MCGIAGIVDPRGSVPPARLAAMARLMRHRGPDDEGIALFPDHGPPRLHGGPDTPEDVYGAPIAFAPSRTPVDAPGGPWRAGLLQRRLAIVDLSPTGHNPLCDPTRRWWITYNGEVYNFVELRAELEALGERFVGGSDTEVILAAYARWGEGCLARLNGMFGIAIWDARERTLFLARDRFGVKPVYFQFDGRTLAFASEPKALVLTQATRPVARPAAVRDLLALDWVDHSADTFFEGLRQLPAAHYLVYSERGLRIHRWWALDPEARTSGTPEALAQGYAERFTDAVRLRLRADVEVGACLSGGLDSSAVVTTAGRLANAGLHAFSCAYDEGAAFDERVHMRAAAEASGATLHLTVPDGGDLWDVFDTLTAAQDEPTAGPGLFSQWKVMELAHAQRLKVLLDGQGGDETLAGYFRYLPTRLRDLAEAGDWPAFAALWGPVAAKLGLPTTLLHTFEPWLPAPFVAHLRRALGQGKDRVLARSLAALPVELPRWPDVERSGLWRHLAFDTLVRQLPGLLRYEDRNSMAFSIETRLPFLDYRLVEYAFSLPDGVKLDGATTKAVARRALADRVPPTVLARRDKMGFETPTDLWLRRRYADEAKRRLTRPGPFQDWIAPHVLTAELDGFLAGRRPIGLQVWRWLSLEAWATRYLATDPRVA